MFKKIITTLFTVCLIATPAFAAKKEKMQMPPTVVSTAQVQQKNWQDSIMETGTLTAYNGIMLSPEMQGRITKIYFKSGQMVKKGDPLIQIYPDVYEAKLERAKAQLKKSTSDYKRYLELYKKGFVDKSTLDSYTASMDSDKADVDQYVANLNELLIKAPFDAKVGLRKISLGDYVKPGDQLVSLQSLDPIRADFYVPDHSIA